MPLVEPAREPADEPRSLLEHSIIQPIAKGMHRPENREKLLTYSEVIEVRLPGPHTVPRLLTNVLSAQSPLTAWHRVLLLPATWRLPWLLLRLHGGRPNG